MIYLFFLLFMYTNNLPLQLFLSRHAMLLPNRQLLLFEQLFFFNLFINPQKWPIIYQQIYNEGSFRAEIKPISMKKIKADLGAVSFNKEASVITMKSKDFIYF